MHHLHHTLTISALTSLLGMMLLQSCGPIQIRDTQAGNWVASQAGILELHRDIHIPGERTRVFFQGGAQLPRVNEFQPFCQLEVTYLRDSVQTVHADRFTITRVGRKTEEVVALDTVMVASLGNVAWLSRGDSGPLRVTEMLYFRLHSDRQPEVRELACGGAFDAPGLAYAPTVQQIATALGEHARLLLR